MSSRNCGVGLSKEPVRPDEGAAPAPGKGRHYGIARVSGAKGSMGRRVLLVLVLTPALIFFMSRKDVDHAANKPESRHHVFERWPSSRFNANDRTPVAYPGRPWRPWRKVTFYRGRCANREIGVGRGEGQCYDSDPRSATLVYARAMSLAGKYDSRPYWNRRKLEVGISTDRDTADLAIEHLIPCESMGKTINRVDSNGKMSYGILQFQDWDEWEAVSGLRGNPDNREDAIRMAEWAVENGMVNHWTCAQILRMM